MRLPDLLILLWLAPALYGETGELRTPKVSPAPRINGPTVYGARPGRPFLYRIPCSGSRPIHFEAVGLPKGLHLDGQRGIISGTVPAARGEHRVKLRARNQAGETRREFRIVVGDTLALTPPMGWNDWYTHYSRITDKLMREAADAMISSGMADAGYQYVNIDDCWMRKLDTTDPETGGDPRDKNGEILPNSRFPDMRGLTGYIHGKGLKAGIYTSPGPATCAKFAGSWEHERQDARTFAAWGFDFLKYDWCSYGKLAGGKTLDDMQKPYRKMGEIVRQLDRDMIFNLCQYGMGEVWKWGGEIGGHCWRTTGDLGWEKDARLPGFYSIGFKNARQYEYAAPGRWNDPDYILIGSVGNTRSMNAPPIPTKLTADEQYSYMSMWSLMASPLFYSGDMGHLDEFTLNVLTNAEVIGVNQDALGKQARIVRQSDSELVLAKPLEGGAVAIGLFNLAEEPRVMSVRLEEIGITGPASPRDVWRQKAFESPGEILQATVARHGVEMMTVSPRRK